MKMRACEKSRNDIAQHYRLFQPFEQHRHHGAHQQYESKVSHQALHLDIAHLAASGCDIACRGSHYQIQQHM